MLDVKKGDRVIVTGHRSEKEETVDSVGPQWITVGRSRFNRRTGYGEYGSYLYTIEGYAKRKREQAATAALSRLGLHVDHGSALRSHVEALVEAVLAIVPEMRAKIEGEDR